MLRSKLSYYVAAQKLERVTDKLDAMNQYLTLHAKWVRKCAKLAQARARRAGKYSEHLVGSSSSSTVTGSGGAGSSPAKRGGRAHLLGSPSPSAPPASSSSASASTSARRSREHFARSEEDVYRLIQQI
ncbi:hypothetical protein AMAG_08683 [Allomyces macrogynus ATCC 38327]|nr:hypothetical protein AMAG_08683 [Allomyces macrogynus ATCC 38327]|eukprot:KNE63573.1 hypothetical protein AMAG_08683 [Allomyces macrogynus ATCC 38327]